MDTTITTPTTTNPAQLGLLALSGLYLQAVRETDEAWQTYRAAYDEYHGGHGPQMAWEAVTERREAWRAAQHVSDWLWQRIEASDPHIVAAVHRAEKAASAPATR